MYMMHSNRTILGSARQPKANHMFVRQIVSALYLLAATITFVESYMVNIDAGIENECYHERVPVGVKLGFSFEVIEGGFYDIDYVIKDPNNVILHQEDKASAGKITIEATSEGPYSLCFSNRKVSYTPKFVIFDIERSDAIKAGSTGPADGTKKDEETEKLMKMVESLLMSAITSRHDVRYLTARDRVHRKINEATNSRIVWWCGIEFILLLAVTLGQVFYLRRFFEIRRKV